jgi:hypothetical protein
MGRRSNGSTDRLKQAAFGVRETRHGSKVEQATSLFGEATGLNGSTIKYRAAIAAWGLNLSARGCWRADKLRLKKMEREQ